MARSNQQAIRTTRVLSHFDSTFGRDDTRLEMWQRLCRDVGVDEHASIRQCKKALKGTYINIVDFVTACEAGTPIRVFPSYKALQNHIRNSRAARFPREEAKKNPILRFMLIKVF